MVSCLHAMVAGPDETWFLHVSTLLNSNNIKIVPSSLNINKIVKFSTKLDLV